MSSALSRIVSHVSPSTIYWLLDTPVGQYVYHRGFTETRPRTIAFDDIEFQMRTPSNEVYLWDDFVENGCHEPATTRAIQEILRKTESADVWDIGSKCGYFMMVAAQAIPPSRIHVFEPTDTHITVIRENNNRYLNGQARVNHLAVGERIDDATTTGDAYAAECGPPTLIKIDVDGPEAGVLRGLQETLENYTPYLLVEVHTRTDWPCKHRELWDLVTSETYEHHAVGAHRTEGEKWQSIETVDALEAIGRRHEDFLLRCSPTARDDESDHE